MRPLIELSVKLTDLSNTDISKARNRNEGEINEQLLKIQQEIRKFRKLVREKTGINYNLVRGKRR